MVLVNSGLPVGVVRLVMGKLENELDWVCMVTVDRVGASKSGISVLTADHLRTHL